MENILQGIPNAIVRIDDIFDRVSQESTDTILILS